METPRRLLPLLLLAGLTVGVCLVLLFIRSSHRTAGKPPSPASNSRANPETLRQVLALEAGVRERDKTIWGPEINAQDFEDIIANLWDELRASPDPLAAAKEIPVGEFFLGTPAATPDKIEHAIEILRLGPPAIKHPGAEWPTWIEQWRADGYSVDQTEWRQVGFEPGPSPTSLVKLTVHLANKKASSRLILKGTLRIVWQKQEGQIPLPAVVHASDFQITRRQGEPAFREVIALEIHRGATIVDPQLILFDLNRDGLSEILIPSENLLYWNRGNGRFDTAPISPGWPSLVHASVVGDFNGDGKSDLLCAVPEGLLLFEGTADGTFAARPARAWTAPESLKYGFVLAAGDVNSDGHPDVWLAQYKQPFTTGQMPTPYHDANDGFPSYLLLNDGRGRFADKTVGSGLEKKRFRRTYSASIADLNDDGKLDLVVVNDFAGIDLYLNDGSGRFTDVTGSLGETHAFGMAHGLTDLNGDGKPDLLMIGMNSPAAQRLNQLKLAPPDHLGDIELRGKMTFGNRLYLSTPNGFAATATSSDLRETGWAWGVASLDFDNDGRLDLYVVNGHKSRRTTRDYESQFWRHDIYLANSQANPALETYFRSVATRLNRDGISYGGYEKNRLLLNRGDPARFTEIGYLMGVALEEDCRNVMNDDLDADGKEDLIVISDEAFPEARQGLHVLRNFSDSTNWIGVRLSDAPGGFTTLGAKIILRSAQGVQHRDIIAGDSFRSQHAATAHFGLGKDAAVESIEVVWPNGKRQTLARPESNRYHAIKP